MAVKTQTFTMTIGGRAVDTDETFPVLNPAHDAVFAQAPQCSPTQLDAAVRAAADAFPDWSSEIAVRRAALADAAGMLKERAEELMPLLTCEQGKPLADSRFEVLGAARWLRYFARLDIPPEVIQDDKYGYVEVVRRPVGPTAAITAWNHPLTLMCWKMGPALLAGCTLVVKPSPYTPLTTLRFGELLREVLPPGVVNVISGRDPLGAELVEHPGIRKVSFTGSTATGKAIARAVARDLKRLTLELGGNDAAIVLDDADPATVADGIFAGAFTNCGQICAAAKRVFVPTALRDEVVDALAARAEAVVVGDGLLEGTEMGPLNNAGQRDRVAGLVTDAVAMGARIAAGGVRPDGPGYFYRPTIVTGAAPGMALVDEEQFGPALPIIGYDDLEDAVAAANASTFGLGGSVWSEDVERARAVAARLDAGTVWVNSHITLAPHQPFGGVKWSGLGVENGPWGVAAFTEVQARWQPPRQAG